MKTFAYNTIPVWQMLQLNVTSDLKYIVILDVYDYETYVPTIEERETLAELYEKNFLQKYEDIPEFLISSLAMACCQLLLGWFALRNSEAEKLYNKRFNEYIAELEKSYKEFEYENETFELGTLLKHLNNQMNTEIQSGADAAEVKLKYAKKKYFATSYISAKKQPKNKTDIMDMVLFAEKITAQNIDYYTFPYVKLKRIISNYLKNNK
jgi:hypothetical protein